MANAIQNAVNKAVSGGNLTQEQATNIMQMVQKNPQALNRLLNGHLGQHLKSANQ